MDLLNTKNIQEENSSDYSDDDLSNEIDYDSIHFETPVKDKDKLYIAHLEEKIIIELDNLDVFEIIKAANNGYPRNPVPYPSPGVGGPCLTKDPYIFSTVLKEKIEDGMTLFEHGRMINESMHKYIVDKVVSEISKLGKDISKSKIFVCGLAFKGRPETGDVRNSSAVEIYHLLKESTKNIMGHDPVASIEEIKDVGVTSVEFQEGIKNSDVVLFLNNNEYYEKLDMYDVVRKMGKNPIIVDGWKIFRAEDILNARPCLYMDLSQIKKSVI